MQILIAKAQSTPVSDYEWKELVAASTPVSNSVEAQVIIMDTEETFSYCAWLEEGVAGIAFRSDGAGTETYNNVVSKSYSQLLSEDLMVESISMSSFPTPSASVCGVLYVANDTQKQYLCKHK